MGILINRMPDFAKMKQISDELDKHPEETEKLIKELKENIVTEGQSWMLPDLSVQRKTTNGPI